MLKSLEFAKNMSFINLAAELDASIMVSALSAHQQSPTYVGSIIEDCINFNVCLRFFFLHVRRETNQRVHYLTKYALHNLDRI